MAAHACDGGLLPLHCASRSGVALTVEFLLVVQELPSCISLSHTAQGMLRVVAVGWMASQEQYESPEHGTQPSGAAKQAATVALPKLIREGAISMTSSSYDRPC